MNLIRKRQCCNSSVVFGNLCCDDIRLDIYQQYDLAFKKNKSNGTIVLRFCLYLITNSI